MTEILKTGGKDYEVHIKVKNGPLMRLLRREGYANVNQFAKSAGITPSLIGEFANLKRSAIGKNGSWLPVVLKIADALRCMPEDMFPEQHIETALPSNSAVFDADLSDVTDYLLGYGEHTKTPEQMLIETETKQQIDDVLNILTPREKRAIRMYYGLDGTEDATLEDVSKAIGRADGVGGEVSLSRTGQILQRALRKLQKPARACGLDALKIDMYAAH